jgi:hypothetical protein
LTLRLPWLQHDTRPQGPAAQAPLSHLAGSEVATTATRAASTGRSASPGLSSSSRASAGGQPAAGQPASALGANLMQLAVGSKHNSCVQAVAHALSRGVFSNSSMLLHLHEALHSLLEQRRHRQLFLSLLQSLPLLEMGKVQVEVDPRAIPTKDIIR